MASIWFGASSVQACRLKNKLIIIAIVRLAVKPQFGLNQQG